MGSPYKVVRTAQDGDKDVYWATFSNLNSNAELSAPKGGITAYDATVSAGKLTLTGRSVQVAAGEGVLLRAECEYVNAKNIDDIAHLQFSPAINVFASETLDISITPVGQVRSAWYKIGEDGTETAITGENFWYYTFSGYSSINYLLNINGQSQSRDYTTDSDRYHRESWDDITDEINLFESAQSTVLVATPSTPLVIAEESGYKYNRLTYENASA